MTKADMKLAIVGGLGIALLAAAASLIMGTNLRGYWITEGVLAVLFTVWFLHRFYQREFNDREK